MKHIGIVGSRQFNSLVMVLGVVDDLIKAYGDITIVSGGARGADHCAKVAAEMRHLPYIEHRLDSPAAFEAFGEIFVDRAFGRNGWIVRDSDIIICFFATAEPHGGTLNTLNQARRAGKQIHRWHPTDSREGRWVGENVQHRTA